jgi:glycosyltransferase involved in cell wall biosynthesis
MKTNPQCSTLYRPPMKILIVTPLYPPDIAGPAPYVKELASRLKDTHSITVLAYNHIPEEISDVRIVTVEKNKILPVRLFAFTYSLFRLLRDADIVYVQNGPSVELPTLIAMLITQKLFILRLGDETALCHATKNFRYNLLLQTVMRYSRHVITHSASSTYTNAYMTPVLSEKAHDTTRPNIRPETLPFTPYPKQAFEEYESSWEKHIAELNHIFTS